MTNKNLVNQKQAKVVAGKVVKEVALPSIKQIEKFMEFNPMSYGRKQPVVDCDSIDIQEAYDEGLVDF